jgi:two-component system cell cycle response regulator
MACAAAEAARLNVYQRWLNPEWRVLESGQARLAASFWEERLSTKSRQISPGGAANSAAQATDATSASGGLAREIAAELDELELVPFSDAKAAFGPAVAIERRARDLGLEGLERRAQLIQADVLGRIGKHTASGQLIREINEWAQEQNNQQLLARSHRLLSMFFDAIGDHPSAWQHALRAVELLDDSASDRLRAEHLFGLGMALQRSGALEEARNRYVQALHLAEGAEDAPLRLKILNNLAWLEDDAGDAHKSLEIANRMPEFAKLHNMELDAACLDTIAHAQLLLGKFAEAEKTLRPILDDQHLDFRESEGLAEALRTAAEAQREQGRVTEAQLTLDRCLRLCEDRGFGLNRLEAMEEQAKLYAAQGDFQKAYQQHIAFHEADVTLRAAAREANSRTLQAVFETQEARYEGERFRELALRDALTGLRNRRYVDNELPIWITQAINENTPLAVALLDVDHFKEVNDGFSHAVGDLVLGRIAELLTAAVAQAGLTARMGGEEFLVVLAAADAGAQYEALRKRIETYPWAQIARGLAVTVSIGATRLRQGRMTQAALLGQADRHLYAAKSAGRNLVVFDPD